MLLLGRLLGASGILYGLLFWYIWWANGFFMVRCFLGCSPLKSTYPAPPPGALTAVCGVAGPDDGAEQCVGGELPDTESRSAQCAAEFPVLYRGEPGPVHVDISSIDVVIAEIFSFFHSLEHGDGGSRH